MASIINDEEFLLRYDINTAKSPDFPYWNYEAFALDSMSDDECQMILLGFSALLGVVMILEYGLLKESQYKWP